MKILKSLVIVVAMAAIAAGATGALFSGQGSIAGNTFTAGTLTIDITHGALKPWDVKNFAPGYVTAWEQASITNTGSIAGNLTMSAPYTVGSPDLYNALNIEININGTEVYNGPVNSVNIGTVPVLLNAGNTLTIWQRVSLPDSGGDQNYLQNKTTNFDEVFNIQQP